MTAYKLIGVSTVKEVRGTDLVDMNILVDGPNGQEVMDYTYSPTDDADVAKQLREWWASNPDFLVTPAE